MASNQVLDHLRIRSGVLDIPEEIKEKKEVTLTVNTRAINVFNVTEEDIKYLDAIMEVAYYSDNNTKVTDVSVRNSKYTKTFDLNVNVEAIMKKMNLTKVSLRPYKLNLYTEGSFFAAHKDTNRPGLVGTLILILPTTYTGGEICFSDSNLESSMPKDKLRFIYFDIGLEHSIDKVVSGHRITLIYNVFCANSSKNLIDPNISLNSVPPEIYKELLREAVKFCKNKQNVLFGECKYRNDVFYELLKGLKKRYKVIKVLVEKNDHSFAQLQSNDISKVVVVYRVDEDEIRDFLDQNYDPDVEGLSKASYEVEHVLFPLVSIMKEHSIQGSRYSEHRYAGNSPEESDYEIECYAAYLINPSSNNDDSSPASASISDDTDLSLSLSDDDDSPPEEKRLRISNDDDDDVSIETIIVMPGKDI